jgi:hypothetical protein
VNLLLPSLSICSVVVRTETDVVLRVVSIRRFTNDLTPSLEAIRRNK